MTPRDEIEAGGRLAFEGGWQGAVTAFEPPHVIQFTPDDSSSAFLRFEVSEADERCQFRLIDRMSPDLDAGRLYPDVPPCQVYQPGGPGTHWSGIIAGYLGLVDELGGTVTGNKPDFEALCLKVMAWQDEWFGQKG